MATTDLDAQLLSLYRKKCLDSRWMGHVLHLELPVDVFSSHQVDLGTQRLLRRIAARGGRWGAVLDLGCGYGPIGLHLAAAGVADRVDAVDRDALAVAFTAHNARRNELAQVDARGGIAYEHVAAAAYDAVVTNLPAKAGPSVHRLMLLGARRHLREGGEVWLVAIESLAEAIGEILAIDAVNLRERVRRRGHVVYGYSFSADPPMPAAPYVRATGRFDWKGHAYSLTSLHGLREFDSRNWATDLVLDVFRRHFPGKGFRSMMVCNSGQGHLAVVASRVAGPAEEIVAVSRDLIALKATRANLRENGYEGRLRTVHAADFASGCEGTGPDVVLAVLNEKETIDVNVEKLRRLFSACDGCRAVVGCRSAFAGRLAERLREHGLRASARKKRKGFSAMLLA